MAERRSDEEQEAAAEPSTLEVGLGAAKVKLTGQLARQAAGVFMLAAACFVGYTKLQNVLTEVRAMRWDVAEIKVTVKAVVDNQPPVQQQKTKRDIEQTMAALRLLREERR